MHNLNFFDIIILVIFFASILIGLVRGFLSEMVSLIVLIVAFVVAIAFTSPLANAITHSAFVQNLMHHANGATGANANQPVTYAALAISFGLLFFGAMIVGWIVKLLISAIFQVGMMGVGNRLLGGVFGFARGVLINLVLIFILQLTPVNAAAWWHQSYFVNQYQPLVVWLGGLVSPVLSDLKSRFGQTLQSLSSQLQNVVK